MDTFFIACMETLGLGQVDASYTLLFWAMHAGCKYIFPVIWLQVCMEKNDQTLENVKQWLTC